MNFGLRNRLQLLLLALAISAGVANAEAASAGTIATAASPPAVDAMKGGNSNVVVQLFGYVKDSVVRTVDGTKEMWSNHGRCNEIRKKQKDYREQLKKQWELQEKGLTPQEMKRRLQATNGGITYDEFAFLYKGKEDRGKLMNLFFLMWGAPKLFPYALMFYPTMLPSPFAPMPNASSSETKLEKLSRQRAHAVIQTLIKLENEAKSIPALGKLNIFGKKSQQRKMETMDSLGRSGGIILATPGATGAAGLQIVMSTLDPVLYKMEEWTRAEKRLIAVPKSVVTGLMTAISGPTPFSGFMPNFMARGNVFAHTQKVTEADKFLVNEKVDLDTLSTSLLLEACNERLIGSSQRSDEELRKDLTTWLEMAVVKPSERVERTGENFNENMARAALMSYFALEATRDSRSTSYLPRLMFQGQLQHDDSKQESRKKGIF